MVLVLGLGKSGKEVALLLKQKGEDVTVVESQKNFSTILRKEELEKYNIKVIFHPYEDSILQDAKLVVVSPGLPLSLPVIEKAKNLNIPVIGEIDVACRFIEKENIIGITGTNGKTTTTFLTYKLLKKAGKKVKIGGNIGVPLCRVARKLSLEENYKIVTEVSSFQLEAGTEFSPGIYCILNIAPNHLDRHSSFSEYLQIKASPLSRMKKEDIVFLNYDQPELKELEKKTCAKVIFFSKREKIKEGIFLREGKIFANIEGKKFKISLTPQLLKKFHNPENVLCATGICLVEGVLPEVIEDFLSFYTPLPHRQEIVGEIRGVKFIDDSKATNPSAVASLLDILETPAVFIMGGKDKGVEFSSLADKLSRKAKAVLLIGEAREKIKRQLSGNLFLIECQDLSEAVRIAFSLSREGECVVLSPGCSSFDQFKNYRHRGRAFKKEVERLKREIESKD